MTLVSPSSPSPPASCPSPSTTPTPVPPAPASRPSVFSPVPPAPASRPSVPSPPFHSAHPPWFQVGDDAVQLLRDGVEAFPAMLGAIEGAKREILLEMYWVGADALGQRFRDALAKRAREGIIVRVIYDSLGSLGMTSRWWQPLVDAGGEVREYHALFPVERLEIGHLELRDHRKLLVVDGAIGVTGGINLSMQWAPIDEGGEGWRDDAVAVRGPCAGELRSLFYETWRRMTGERPRDVLPFPKQRTRPVWVLANNWRRQRSIRREYIIRIAKAKHAVDVANPYFVPDGAVRRALFGAVARGARVRVVVPIRGDVPVVQFAVEALFDQLLRHGVEVYVIPGPVLHAKTAIVDEMFATVGSYNLDQRSWRKNLEVNLAVEDAAFARHVRAWFDHDVSRSMKIDLTSWRQRGAARRAAEWAAFALRKLL